jgi:parallel beta-helix repeat protein
VRRGRVRRTAGISGALAVAVVVVGLAAAPGVAGKGKRKLEVRPGPDAIENALDRARGGDVLRIHKGRYEESPAIERRVKLVGVGKRRPVIDAGCSTRTTIEAQADGVRLKRLKVVGAATATEVDFNGVSGGRVDDLVVRDTCDAEYGINVFDAGPMEIVDSRATGFDDAGFYIGQITSTPGGAIRLRRSESYANLRGLIVENSAGGQIVVRRNDFHHNNISIPPALPTGILITNSDGVRVAQNEIADNARFGLHLTADSDRNLIDGNVFLDNPVDVSNEGTGNCGSGNAFETGDALPPC